MKQLKSIIAVLLLTLAFAFSASATETYRKSYVGGQNGCAKSGSTQSSTQIGAANHTANLLTHHNNSNKPQ
jgi:hypothetical protein